MCFSQVSNEFRAYAGEARSERHQDPRTDFAPPAIAYGFAVPVAVKLVWLLRFRDALQTRFLLI